MKFRPCYGLPLSVLAAVTLNVRGAVLETNALPSFQQASGDPLKALIQVIGALVLVVAIVLVGAWFFKRSRLFAFYQGGPAQLKILESRSLGYRNSLLVVGYCQHRFLVAVTTSGVSLLSPLPDVPLAESPGAIRQSFADQLGAVQERKA
jgi:flagellar biogenesis protein FliO